MDRYAKRTGGRVFFIGASLQMLLFLTVGAGLLVYQYYIRHGSEFRSDVGFWEFIGSRDITLLLKVSFISGLLFMIASFVVGRWGGPMISGKRWNFGWVGLLAMMVPAFVAGFASACMIVGSVAEKGDKYDPSNTEMIVYITLTISAIFYVPSLITGPLSGLSVRQLCRMRQDQLMEMHPIDHPIAVV